MRLRNRGERFFTKQYPPRCNPLTSNRRTLIVGRRSCAGDNARPATDGRANRRAGRAPDRKRYETANRRAKASAHRPTRHDATRGIRVPTCTPIVISTIIGRVGDPANMPIVMVGVVPIGVVVDDRHVWPVGIQTMDPPAIVVLIAGDIGSFDSLGARDSGRRQGCACKSEKRSQFKRSVKPSHGVTFSLRPVRADSFSVP
jgi:hypothetical protein